MEYDIIVRGGTVVDGTRLPRYRADVGIRGGRVIKLGRIAATATAERVLDATGCIVAPGFVDLHTHYDAQIHWDPYCTISGWHGVTSVVLGNCGFGFAPVKPADRDRALMMMTRTEQIPYESMKAGMPWKWESLPEWLDNLDALPKGVNVVSYVPVSPLMVYVMGLEAAKSRPATPAERAEMQRLLERGDGRRRLRLLAAAAGRALAAGRRRRHADADRHHGRRGRAGAGRGATRSRRGLHPDHPGPGRRSDVHGGRREEEPRPRVRRAPRRRRRAPGAAQRRRRRRRQALAAREESGVGAQVQRAGPADLRPGLQRARLVQLLDGALEPLRLQPGLERRHPRHDRREADQARRPGGAREDEEAAPHAARDRRGRDARGADRGRRAGRRARAGEVRRPQDLATSPPRRASTRPTRCSTSPSPAS